MSKVVTIPTYQSPFVVMVNGVKYVFPAGSVQEVPDEVAVVIEANSRKKPEEPVDAPFDCCEGGGSGGGTQPDWNQTDSYAADFIKNKPFGDMPTGGDTLYWDGNTEGLVSGSGIADGEKINAYYKISDTVPTKNDFANGFTFAVKNPLDGTDVNIEISASDAQSSFSDDGFAILADGLFAIIPLGGYIFSFNELEITCPEPGVYHITPMMVSAVANTLTIPGYTGFPVTKKMEEKYLPNNHTRFYYVGDDYLYSDLGVSKVTVEELKTAARKGLIIVQIGANSSMTCSPLDINILTNDVIEYCALTIWHDEFITLYTAEYTAS